MDTVLNKKYIVHKPNSVWEMNVKNVNRIFRHKKAIATIWILLILFPNPALLPLNIYRFFEMPTHPTDDVQHLADSLPANATAIESYVDSKIHYAYDFHTYGAVWYLPTPSEVLKAQQGDCKSKAVLLASLLEAKQIPYSIKASPVHFWVDYGGKLPTNFTERYETTEVAFVENGQFKLPGQTNALLYFNVYKDLAWTSMPLFRKVMLVTGLVLIIQFGHFQGAKKRLRFFLSGLLQTKSITKMLD
jgi:transglutaminase-like putative cysteine protease